MATLDDSAASVAGFTVLSAEITATSGLLRFEVASVTVIADPEESISEVSLGGVLRASVLLRLGVIVALSSASISWFI